MKKILLMLFVCLLSLQGFNQTKFKRNKITADTMLVNYYFIWQGDTIPFDELASVQFSSDTTNWHATQVVTDSFFRIRATGESYYRHMKIWDGRTLDLDTYRIINLDTAINDLDAVNYVLLKDTASALRSDINSKIDSALISEDALFTSPSNDSVSSQLAIKTFVLQSISDTVGLIPRQPFDSVLFSTDQELLNYQEGKLYYDSDTCFQSLVYYNDEADIKISLGFGLFQKVYNNNNFQINKGQAVYIDETRGMEPTISLANSKEYDKSRLIGLAAHDIEVGSGGYVMYFGVLYGIDLTGCKPSSTFYLGETDGSITTEKPSGGNFPIRVGFALKCDANGNLLVNISTNEYTDEIIKAFGFPSYEDSYTTLDFDNATRGFRILPVEDNFYYYQNGVKYIKQGDSLNITEDEGLHLIYFDTTSLVEILNPTPPQIADIIKNKTTVSYIYWDATNSKEIYFANERHTFHFNSWLHSYLHFGFGALWLNGVALTDLITNGNGSLDAHAQFGVGSGTIQDEDIIISTPTITSTSSIPYYYLDGVNWRRDSLLTFSFPVGATPLPQYNQIVGGSGSLVEISSGYFVLNHLFAINDNRDYNKIVAIVGQNEYTSLANAQLGAQSEINSLEMSGINFAEFTPIATVIIEGKTSFTNSVNARLRVAIDPITGETVDYVDWRGRSAGGGGGSVSASSFLDLNDTPGSYSGESEKIVRVNVGETGVEFTEEYDPVYIADTSNIAYLDQFNIFAEKMILQQSGQILNGSDTAINADAVYDFVLSQINDSISSVDLQRVTDKGNTTTNSITALNYISTVATGTQPYATTSTTLNTNLNADLLDGQQGNYYNDWANHTGTVDTLSTDINRTNWLAFLDNKYIGLDEKGAVNGVATLDGNAKIPISQIPDALIGAVVYQGTWNATTNTPTIVSSTGTKGHYYTVSVAGNTIIDGTGNWKIGDMIIFNGTIWEKIDNNHDVTSVNGKTGAVVITTSSNTTGQLTVTNGSTDPQLNIITASIVNGETALATGDQIYDYVENRETPFDEFTISADGQNNFTTTITIKTGSTVYYNERILGVSDWSGEGTTTLTILTFPRYKNDKIFIYYD
jgi:hypothetical protein